MSEKGNGTVGGVWKGVVLVLLTIVTLLLLCIVYQGLKGENPLTKVKESVGFSTETEVAIPTVQERLNKFSAEGAADFVGRRLAAVRSGSLHL